MSDESISSTTIPPACRFFREIMADAQMTDHDLHIAMQHTKECKQCEDEIGEMIHRMIKGKRAEVPGS
jgi:hypothetical protein